MGSKEEAKRGGVKPVLEGIANQLELPEAWRILDRRFSPNKVLFPYQYEALENALKILHLYYGDCRASKEEFARLYTDYYNELSPRIKNSKLAGLLSEFFELERGVLPFKEIANRMGFWMATGSGKTLIIVKLAYLLFRLMEESLLPVKPILFLTAREDLVGAFLEYLEEFNKANSEERMRPFSLRDYERYKVRDDLFRKIFYYRYDLLSDERGEKTLDFRAFLDRDREGNILGNWYVILDEAHKGDKNESKRQFIVSALAKDGFLFNFSATFTDPIDIATTVYNFNLHTLISQGYGKQIFLFRTEVRGFDRGEKREFTSEEKRKLILKTLLLLTGLKRAKARLPGLYHSPMALYLVNSVNKEDSDLRLLFEELLNVGRRIDTDLFHRVKVELLKEFDGSEYTIGSGKLDFMKDILEDLQPENLYREVFNAYGPGEIEYVYSEENDREVALSLTSSRGVPFALIKIGRVSEIQKNFLWNYRETKVHEDPRYFDRLNEADSPINLLIGSRAFYEGWDSPRPNLITFVNLGTQIEARKFVLQATGRGVRIEPLKDKRLRLDLLLKADKSFINHVGTPEVKALESLFIFATNRRAMETVLKELEFVKEGVGNFTRKSKDTSRFQRASKLRMSERNYQLLKLYLDLVPVERFLLERNCLPSELERIKELLKGKDNHIEIDDHKHFRNLDRLLGMLLDYVRRVPGSSPCNPEGRS